MKNNRAQRLSLTNRLLLGSVAASVAMIGYGRVAYAACVTDGTTITCTGDLSAGVTVPGAETTLNVNSLTTNITPAVGTSGINFTSGGDITIVSDTGPFGISVSGAAQGIYITSGSTISVTHTGDIISNDHTGIYAYSFSDSVATVSTGNIQAEFEGIFAFSNGAGAVSVTHTGDITSASSQGFFAHSDSGSVTTVSTGNIQADDEAIYAHSNGAGAVSVTHTGDITSDNSQGILAISANGDATIVSIGNIRSISDGIYADSVGAGASRVIHMGDINSEFGRGIVAHSVSGSVTTVSIGNIQVDDEGIRARSDGASAVSVTHTGDIASASNRGIYARSDTDSTTTVSIGDIHGHTDGIYALSGGAGAVNVTHTGDITSNISRGIRALATAGSVTTVSSGNIQSDDEGIYARSDGAGAVNVTHTGDITSDSSWGLYAYSFAGSVEITLGDGVVQGLAGIGTSSATGTTLNLNAGSVVIDDIVISGPAVLNTGAGLSIAHTFTGTVPTIGDVSGNVAAVSGNQIAVADISGLAAADNQLSVTLDSVSGVLGASRDRATNNWWLSAFGGARSVQGAGTVPKAMHGFGGLVAGTHAILDNGMPLGVFGGLSKGVQTASVTNGVRTDTSSFFGGIYGNFAADMLLLDFAVAAGGASNDGTRIVANNTAATGLETAQSSYASFFLAPEFTLSSTPIEIQDFSFIPSLRMRYEVLQSAGFTETGVTAGALTAGAATSHALNMRLQAAVPIDLGNPAQTLVVRGGIDARFATTGGRDATLLGVATNGAGAGDEFAGGGFAGLDFTHVLSDVAMLTANGELRAGTTGISATANLGVKGDF